MNGKATPTKHPGIVVLGSQSDFTAQAVDTLCESGVPPAAVLTGASPGSDVHGRVPVEVRGRILVEVRGRIPVEVRGPVARVAAAHGVELVRTPHPNHPDTVAALERIEPDLLLIACLPHVVDAATRRTARLGALNLHPSALPRFRGPDPVFWQLRAGVERAGVTVHVATHAVDAGPIVLQRWVEVRPGVGARTLTAALVRSGVRALADALPVIERRIREASPQDESAATRQPRPRPEDFRIDASWTAERAYRFIEGTRGPATTFTVVGAGREIEVERAVGFDAPARPGSTAHESGPVARGSDPAARGSDPTGRESDPTVRESGPAGRESDPAARGSDPTIQECGSTVRESDPTVRESEPAGREPGGIVTIRFAEGALRAVPARPPS